jgi:hypothetical protein
VVLPVLGMNRTFADSLRMVGFGRLETSTICFKIATHEGTKLQLEFPIRFLLRMPRTGLAPDRVDETAYVLKSREDASQACSEMLELHHAGVIGHRSIVPEQRKPSWLGFQ